MINEFALVPKTNVPHLSIDTIFTDPKVSVIAFKLQPKISVMRGQFVPAVQVCLTVTTPTCMKKQMGSHMGFLFL